MSNEMITQLPTASSASLSDIIYAVQGYSSPSSPGTSVQETLQQIFNLILAQTILNNAGNPNGSVAGNIYQFCIDISNSKLYICTTTGSSSSAIWTLYGANIISPLQGGTGVSNPVVHSVPIAGGASNFTFKTLTNGQLLIGSTGNDPVAGSLIAGSNITISNSAGAITIASSGAGGFSWTVVTGSSQNMSSFNGYFANKSSLVTLTLPPVSNVGDSVSIVGIGSGGWSIAQGASQQINVGSTASTSGTGGSISSTNQFDSINLVCSVANTSWINLGAPQGNLTIV